MKEKREQPDKRPTNMIFILSAAISILLAAWGIIGSASFKNTVDLLMVALKQNFSWLYLGVVLFFVLFSVVVAFSKFGKIRLGADDERPEYSMVSWFAMLFAAGMGIGLVFWGVAEPLSHYVSPDKGIEPCSAESAAFAIRSCFMHWGFHPWGIYAVMGLGLAFFQFRRKETAMVSNMFKPIWGEKVSKGAVGKAIDIFTTILTVIGVATSFGMGCLQICGGLEYLFGIPNQVFTWVIVIAVICCIYIKSSTSGIGSGIRILSNSNLVLIVLLAALTMAVGPTGDIVKTFFIGIKDYVMNFFQDSLRLSAQGDSTWIQNWRVFYWAWWLSWAPFVGLFIARISRGRTVREFILGVMLAPTLVSCVWFAIMGGASLHVAGNFTAKELLEISGTSETALFYIFDQYDFGIVLSILALILLVCFFITSADSATFVLAMLTSDGDLEPPNKKKIFWGIAIALIALSLILSGGVAAVQTISIVIAFPYLFILLLLCITLVKEMSKEIKKKEPRKREKETTQ